MNKVMIGKGTLQEFSEDYEKVAEANKGRMWSQLYPTGQARGNSEEFNQLYEWVIGYESNFVAKKTEEPKQEDKPKHKLVI